MKCKRKGDGRCSGSPTVNNSPQRDRKAIAKLQKSEIGGCFSSRFVVFFPLVSFPFFVLFFGNIVRAAHHLMTAGYFFFSPPHYCIEKPSSCWGCLFGSLK